MTGAASLGVRTSPPPPVRIVHLGLGAFHRSHQAWYTGAASDADEWGIAAYSGRSGELAEALTLQDGLYTLVVRSREGDRVERVDSIARAHAGSDVAALIADLAAPTTAVVTLTITEAVYSAPPSERDHALLVGMRPESDVASLRPDGALSRLVVGLEARRRAESPPLAVVSCDNLPDNGGVLRRAVAAIAESVPGLTEWIGENVSFVSSSVDRITPRVTAADAAVLRDRYGDRVPVVTEPFADWVLSGDFPAGRPRWEDAGARLVADLEPWEARKLWLLNGAHTLLASLGRLRGHASVSEAIADDECASAVEGFWDEACRHLPDELDLQEYRAALRERFANPRIVHLLEQIALDSETKIRLRVLPVAERERRDGRTGEACASVIAAWMAVSDHPEGEAAVRRALAAGESPLADDDAFVVTVLHARSDLDILTLG